MSALLLLSVVAYSVVMGALMASGKEVIGRVPKGKVIRNAPLACENGNVNPISNLMSDQNTQHSSFF